MINGVTIRIEGLMLEKLMERAMQEGARFKWVKRLGRREMLVETDGRGERVLSELAQRFSMGYEVTRRSGINFLIHVFRRRITLVAGLVAFAVIVLLMFSRIWIIDVELIGGGADFGDAGIINRVMEEMGIYPGMAKSELNDDLLALELNAHIENSALVTVRTMGVRLLIEAAPEIPAPEVYDLERARDLVASRDGIIKSITVRSGVAKVQAGDTVQAGQLLIGGEERVAEEETRGIGALGQVTAVAYYEGECRIPIYGVRREFTGRESLTSTLNLFGFEIELLTGESFSKSEKRVDKLPVCGMFLPLMITRVSEAEYEEKKIQLDIDELKSRAGILALADSRAQLSMDIGEECQIVDCWIDYTVNSNDELIARSVIEVEFDIAVTRDEYAES